MHNDLPIATVPWNTFLATIPVVLAYAMLWVFTAVRRRWLRNLALSVMGAAWVAFLPNTCYLLTEWRHFLMSIDARDLYLQSKMDKAVFAQLCVMTMFYTAYSGFGVVAFALAIRPVEKMARAAGAAIWVWGLPFFTAMSVGVYLGLVLRLNSWDLVQRPGLVWYHVSAVGGRPLLAAFVVAFGVFLWALYESVDLWVDALTDRWSVIAGRSVHLGPGSREGVR